MLVASRPIGLLDRYRVPYVVEPTGTADLLRIARLDGTGGELLSFTGSSPDGTRPYQVDGARLHAALTDRKAFDLALQEHGGEWQDEIAILDLEGRPVASVRIAADESIALPFDLDEPLDALLAERYVGASGSRVRSLVSGGYYLARPILPYRFQMALRRRFLRLQDRASFPAWPTETSLHRLESLLLGLVERLAGEPLPWISPWPNPFSWALVLTHDVERAAGCGHVDEVLDVEERFQLHSAWYLVPERDYDVGPELLDRLRDRGCEVCLHGLRHDGRDLSRRAFPKRLPAMRSYLERWDARGFRGPATHRDRQLVQEIGVDHDSSWADVARYEPQPGGTCSWLPFFIGNVVELPITLPMDHTLFELQRVRSADPWIEKAAFIRAQGGMALMVTHPDYLFQDQELEIYERFLTALGNDPAAWQALPHEVSEWWRRRAASRLEHDGATWTVVGPAAPEAHVRLGAPAAPPVSPAASVIEPARLPEQAAGTT